MARPHATDPSALMLGHPRGAHDLDQESILKRLFEEETSSWKKYQLLVVGRLGFRALLEYECLTMLLGSMPGALGLVLRTSWYPRLFKRVGSKVLWGRNISLRHPGRIELGSRVVIDDNCLLDAKGTGEEGIRIGNDVLVSRGTILQGKAAGITIGDQCLIGSYCHVASVGGIGLGNSVMVAGGCYIGGGRHHLEDTDAPMMDQGLYSEGPVIIEDDVWLGAGVVVQDGVRIGRGCVVGSGAVVTRSLPPYAVAVGVPATILRMRRPVPAPDEGAHARRVGE